MKMVSFIKFMPKKLTYSEDNNQATHSANGKIFYKLNLRFRETYSIMNSISYPSSIISIFFFSRSENSSISNNHFQSGSTN